MHSSPPERVSTQGMVETNSLQRLRLTVDLYVVWQKGSSASYAPWFSIQSPSLGAKRVTVVGPTTASGTPGRLPATYNGPG